ncbi:DMT family transporter [uncultured Eudoraea sp.]|uniref:DMT family transporter n=1 Tax=uncultured Eudoraea sp. TaxID=1035614 RepID=UPI0026070B51|nr:DMT family transporter [uncultured Eudoraea sp.]
MLNDKLKNYLHLHLIVLIWGFTAVLGKLISIDAIPLVWYRMLIASALVAVFILIKRNSIRVSTKTLIIMLTAGVIIALHWVTFFKAIKVSNVSIALVTMSTGALFTAFLEPIWYGRRMIWYEVLFGLMVVFGLYLIFNVNTAYSLGMSLALISALLGAIFTLINGQLIKTHKPSAIALYELMSGVLFITFYLVMDGSFNRTFFILPLNDWFFIFILASVCTAYAFIAAIKVMRFISPYTVMLTINLEPVYGIILALLIFGQSEKMSPLFYVGALIIVATIIANGILKTRRKSSKGT